MKTVLKILALLVVLVLVLSTFLGLASAVILNSVQVDTLEPGQEGNIRIEIENILSDDVEDLSLGLQFANIPLIPIGTSEQSIDEIEEDEDEDFVFRVKAAPDIVPGDYEIPYVLAYKIQGDDDIIARTGTIGIKVRANPILAYSVMADNPVDGQQGTITLRVVNKGFFDARFVSVRILPEEFTLLSDSEVYIGEVESDDFETASFDVKFTETNPEFRAVVEYINFDNQKVIENVVLPITVYTEERAVELGIIQPNRSVSYLLGAVTVILLIILWRIFRKRARLKRSQRLQERR